MLALTLNYPTPTTNSTIVPTPHKLRQLYEDTKAFQMQAKIEALFNTPQVLRLSDAPHWPAEAEPLPSDQPLPSALVSVLLKLQETFTAPVRSAVEYVQGTLSSQVAHTAFALSVALLIIGCASLELKLFYDRCKRAPKEATNAPALSLAHHRGKASGLL